MSSYKFEIFKILSIIISFDLKYILKEQENIFLDSKKDIEKDD